MPRVCLSHFLPCAITKPTHRLKLHIVSLYTLRTYKTCYRRDTHARAWISATCTSDDSTTRRRLWPTPNQEVSQGHSQLSVIIIKKRKIAIWPIECDRKSQSPSLMPRGSSHADYNFSYGMQHGVACSGDYQLWRVWHGVVRGENDWVIFTLQD